MTLEVASFLKSEYYKPNPQRLKWVETQIGFINNNYLWKPVNIHVTDAFLDWVHKQTNGEEMPPYSGILNPCDKDGNFVLFPWFSTRDWRQLARKAFTQGSGIDEILNNFVESADTRNLFKQSNQGLTIPRSELVIMSNYCH